MNEIILRFDKMMHGRQKTEKKEMLLKDCVPILTEMESEKLVNEVREQQQPASRVSINKSHLLITPFSPYLPPTGRY